MRFCENVTLEDKNSFGFRAIAKRYYICKSIEDYRDIHKSQKNDLIEGFVLGGGSNIVFTKEYYPCVLSVENKGIEILNEQNNFVQIKVQAGEIWNKFVDYCVKNKYGGIENLSLIPGNVGASPIQNIGAYGVELKDVFHSLEAFDKESGRVLIFSNSQCKFRYRESVFKNEYKDQFIIISITLRLTKNKHKLSTNYGSIEQVFEKRKIYHPSISDVREAVNYIRESKLPDPKKLGNAGSFFKNPTITYEKFIKLKEKWKEIPNYKLGDGNIKISAAWLIEKGGWKGKVYENVGVHKNQALVLVHFGGGNGGQIFKLSELIIKDVYKRFKIKLLHEVNIL